MAIEKKNAWEKYPQGPEREKLFAFAEDYRRFISGCKTERECTAAVYADATGHGFVDLDELIETGKSVKAGDRKSTRLNSSHSGQSRMPSSA